MPNNPTKEKRPSWERRTIRMMMEDTGDKFTEALRKYEKLTADLTDEEKQNVRYLMNNADIMFEDAVKELKLQKAAFKEQKRRTDSH